MSRASSAATGCACSSGDCRNEGGRLSGGRLKPRLKSLAALGHEVRLRGLPEFAVPFSTAGQGFVQKKDERVTDRPYLALINHETNGNRCDVTPLFGDYAAFAALVDDLAALVEPLAFEVVVGIDALGFILGAALALRIQTGFVPIRKGGKLPIAVDAAECVDYTGQRKTLELRRDALAPGTRVLRRGLPE